VAEGKHKHGSVLKNNAPGLHRDSVKGYGGGLGGGKERDQKTERGKKRERICPPDAARTRFDTKEKGSAHQWGSKRGNEPGSQRRSGKG